MTGPRKKRPAIVREAAALPTISASVFKATCLELMDDLATRFAEVVVTKHGRPVVRVGPVEQASPSPIGFLSGVVTIHGDIVSSDPAAWRMSDSDPLGGVKW